MTITYSDSIIKIFEECKKDYDRAHIVHTSYTSWTKYKKLKYKRKRGFRKEIQQVLALIY